MDWAALLAHDIWIQPINIIVGLAILLHTIGYSALVGLGVLLLGLPIQGYLFSVLIGTRRPCCLASAGSARVLTA